jgi:hypothetical protein
MKRLLWTAGCLFVMLAWGRAVGLAAGAQNRGDVAVAVAVEWLKGVDGGDYAECWKQASASLRKGAPQERWAQWMGGQRKPLGKVVSRKLKSVMLASSLPDVRDVRYVVVEFATAFEGRQGAVEVVTPTMEADGKWRVSGYLIK